MDLTYSYTIYNRPFLISIILLIKRKIDLVRNLIKLHL